MPNDDDRRRQTADMVKRRRTTMHMTQADLADKVGVHSRTIQNLERGERDTDPATLAKVGRVLGIDLTSQSLRVATESVEVISTEMRTKLAQLTDAERLRFVGDVMAYISAWEPSRRP